MALSTDRRASKDRRNHPPIVLAPLQRKRDRRTGERRDSARLTLQVVVSQGPACWLEECEGDLSLGGARWTTSRAPWTREVELRFALPGAAAEVRVRAQVVQTRVVGPNVQVHAQFVDLDLPSELALARFLDDAQR